MQDRKTHRKSHGVATAQDVADKAGVSLTTVSRCFNDAGPVSKKTLDMVLSVASQLGYSPNIAARLLASRKSNLIGLLVNDFEDPENLDLFRFVSSEAQNRKHHAILLNTSQDKSGATSIGAALLSQVDGLLVAASHLPGEMVERCKAQDKPIVVVGRKSQRPEYSSVYCDNEMGASQVADYFHAQGVKRPAFIGGQPDATVVMERMAGFVRRVEQHYGFQPITRMAGLNDYDKARAATAELLSLSKSPDGFFCSNDLLAIGAKDALTEAANSPEAASAIVVGFGQSMLSRLEAYQLRSVGLPFEKMVRAATSHLIDQIGDQALASTEIAFPCEFIDEE
jgi:DNA-binding LacI/PurR family transcriptional regulator